MLSATLLLAASVAWRHRYNEDPPATCNDVVAGLAEERFMGDVAVPSDNGTYEVAVMQYAFMNDPSRMRPSGVVYPSNVRDVRRAVRYATDCDFRVTVRSGGHQYMGLSSCNQNVHKCLQIDMSNFKKLQISGTRVTVGAGVSLAELYQTLASHGLFLGAGECGTVNVGGHVQTGGYGLLARTFGALADQVRSFQIVLADGRSYRIRRPRRRTSCFNDDTFFAVLGGGAGSWGVVTEYTFEAHRDADYAHSTYWNCMVPYTKDAFADVVEAFEKVSSAAGWDDNHQEALWMTTVKRAPFDTNFIHIEAAWAGAGGAPFDNSSYATFVEAVAGRGLCTAFPAKLSAVLTQFTTFYGEREFPFPYDKRNRVSRDTSLGATFAGTLADQVDLVMQTPGLFFFSQLVTIGGRLLDLEGGDIALPLRNARYDLDLAVFYVPEAKAVAAQVQDAAWAAIEQEPSFSTDLRYVWANWGNVNIEEVNPLYYTAHEYNVLRGIKTYLDPSDTFRTTFTIPALDREFEGQDEDNWW